MAPSRDTAITFAQLDRVKHIVSGGWWFNKLMKSYTRASPRVLEFISQTPDFAHLVGLPSERRIKSGSYHFILSLIPIMILDRYCHPISTIKRKPGHEPEKRSIAYIRRSRGVASYRIERPVSRSHCC